MSRASTRLLARQGTYTLVGEFSVDVEPVTQGNHRAGAFGIYDRSARELTVFRQAVFYASRPLARELAVPLDEPVGVAAVFRLPRPRRPRFGSHPATLPDGDKLARALGDALVTASLLADDGRITLWIIEKVWADCPPGVDVELYVADPAEEAA